MDGHRQTQQADQCEQSDHAGSSEGQMSNPKANA
jgi:hypothetical protein